MYSVVQARSFKKSLRKVSLRKEFDFEFLAKTVESLATLAQLEDKYRDHKLEGEYQGCRECHLNNDLLLIYETCAKENRLYLIKIGTHQDLFGK